MGEKKLTFKEMCAHFDVTPRTLRYYEYIELLSPERDGRARFYGPREVARMELIMRGRRWGFSLEEARQWLLMYDQDGSDAQLQTFIEFADRQLLNLAEQKQQLDAAMRELEDMRDQLKKRYAG